MTIEDYVPADFMETNGTYDQNMQRPLFFVYADELASIFSNGTYNEITTRGLCSGRMARQVIDVTFDLPLQ